MDRTDGALFPLKRYYWMGVLPQTAYSNQQLSPKRGAPVQCFWARKRLNRRRRREGKQAPDALRRTADALHPINNSALIQH